MSAATLSASAREMISSATMRPDLLRVGVRVRVRVRVRVTVGVRVRVWVRFRVRVRAGVGVGVRALRADLVAPSIESR